MKLMILKVCAVIAFVLNLQATTCDDSYKQTDQSDILLAILNDGNNTRPLKNRINKPSPITVKL